MNIKNYYAHFASAFALAPGAWARRGGIAGGLIFLSVRFAHYQKIGKAANIKLD